MQRKLILFFSFIAFITSLQAQEYRWKVGFDYFFDNMEYMNEVGETVFLDVDIQVLFRRLKVAKQQRPLLANKTDEELMAFIQEALEKRLPHYTKAKHVFNGEFLESRRQIQDSVERLKELLKL